MKAVVAAFNQEKALVGAFYVIVKTGCETNGALHSTSLVQHCHWSRPSKQVEITALNQQHSQQQTSRAFSLLIKPSNEWQNGGFKMENSDIHKYKCYMLVHKNTGE